MGCVRLERVYTAANMPRSNERKSEVFGRVLILLVAALVVAGCGGGGAQPTPTVAVEAPAATEEPVAGSAQEAIAQVLDVVMRDIYFGESPDNAGNPPEWTVSAGAEVTLNLQNAGALEHDWAYVAQGTEVPVPFLEANKEMLLWDAGIVPPGESATVSFTAPTDPGIYTVICTVPGHYPAMQGRLVVE